MVLCLSFSMWHNCTHSVRVFGRGRVQGDAVWSHVGAHAGALSQGLPACLYSDKRFSALGFGARIPPKYEVGKSQLAWP